MTKRDETCPICGEGHLEHQIEKNAVEYNGQSALIDSHYSVCDSCGSEQANSNQTRDNKRVMMAFKKQVDGLLTGAELKALRQRLDINQAKAAAIFGGGPVAFSKYENDDVMQSEAMDKLLRVADKFPEAFSYLAQEAGVEISCPSQLNVMFDPAKYVHLDESIILESEKYEVKRPQLRLVHSSKCPTEPVSGQWMADPSLRQASC